MRTVRLVLSVLMKVCVFAPWIWLACFVALCLRTTQLLGHLPSYANPDPKNLDAIVPIYDASWLLLAAALLSPVAVALLWVLTGVIGLPNILRGRSLAAHALGIGLIALVLVGDPLGLTNWYMD